MRTYRNTITGATIEIPSELKGGLWEEVKPLPKNPANEKVVDEAPKPIRKKKVEK